MQHPHLLPEEIELLADGDEGPLAASRRAHLVECDECRIDFEMAESVGRMLDRLPHAAAAPGFSSRVMAEVHVFEPWHVALVDTLRRLVPASTPVRALVAGGAAAMGVTVTAIAVWASLRADLVAYAVRIALARAETAVVTAGGSLVSDVFGEAALVALRNGGTLTVAVGAAVLLSALAAATYGLRGVLALARRRGN
jgi:hypothetical protein